MILDTSKPTERIPYLFAFYKFHKYKGKTILNITSGGSFNTQRLIHEEDSNLPEYIFRSESYHQEGMKEPLIFSPLKWIYNKAEHAAAIKSKEHLMNDYGKPAIGKDGSPIQTRNYEFLNSNREIIAVQEHSLGHTKAISGHGAEPHFNVRGSNLKTGHVDGTHGHYNFL